MHISDPTRSLPDFFRLIIYSTGLSLWFLAVCLPFTGLSTGFRLFPLFMAYSLLRFSKQFNVRAPAFFRTGWKSLLTSAGSILRNVRFLWAVGAAGICFLLTFPLITNNYVTDIGVMVLIYSILALGLNVVVGWTGLLNLGYVAFYAVGAYTFALLDEQFHIGFWLGLPCGVAAAALAGLLLGLPVLRLRGDYLAIVTLGFGEMVRIILNNWDSLTHGPNGIMNVARPHLAGMVLKKPMHFYYLTLFFVVLAVFLLRRIYLSRIGRAWIAVREDELAAAAMGVPTNAYKLLAFIIGALFAGLAGVIFASKMMFISPESFTFMESVTILCMVVLGGMGSIPGCILGSALLVILPELTRGFSSYRMLFFGIALIAMMSAKPQGLLPPSRLMKDSK